MDIPNDEDLLFNVQVLYREWGRRFTTVQQFLKGVQYYKESRKYGKEDDLVTLLGLSEALKKSGQFKEASQVAEQCIRINPDHLGAYSTMMEALFDIADFGSSLVYAYRGVRQRQHFRFAILRANENIEDNVGANVPENVLRQIQPWIVKLTEHRHKLRMRLNDPEDEFQGIDEELTKFKVSDPKARLQKYQKNRDRLMAMIYLGGTGQEKRFLEDLIKHPALHSPNKEGNKLLASITKKSIEQTQNQQESLKMRRPPYAMRAMEAATKTTGRIFAMMQELELRRCFAKKTAVHMLTKLHEARLRRDYPTFFKMVELVKDRMELLGTWLLPQKRRYLEAMYRMVSRAYLDPRNLQRFCDHPEKAKVYMLRLLGLRTKGLPRDSDLAWIPSLNVKSSLNTCRQRLALTNNSLEVLWIFHELCKLFLQMKRYDLARFYAKKTRDLSEQSGNEDWVVNASHVLVRVELHHQNRDEAREAAMEARKYAQKLSVNFLVDFYEQVIAHINRMDFENSDDSESIDARERLMIQIMPDKMRPKMSLLLRSLAAVATHRRLSIMPGCKTRENLGQSMRKTVLTAPRRHYEKEIRDKLLKKFSPNTKTLGLLHFDD